MYLFIQGCICICIINYFFSLYFLFINSVLYFFYITQLRIVLQVICKCNLLRSLLHLSYLHVTMVTRGSQQSLVFVQYKVATNHHSSIHYDVGSFESVIYRISFDIFIVKTLMKTRFAVIDHQRIVIHTINRYRYMGFTQIFFLLIITL